jgi:hypothetical protein
LGCRMLACLMFFCSGKAMVKLHGGTVRCLSALDCGLGSSLAT